MKPARPETTPRTTIRSLAGLLLGLLGLRLALLPLLPLLDPSEARYAGVAKDMLARGDFVTPMLWTHFDYVPFFSKPPLAFWLQALSFDLFGLSATAARLPAFLGCAVLFLVIWFLRRTDEDESTLSSLLVLLSSPLFFVCIGLGLVDIFLAIALTGALWSHDAFLQTTDATARRRSSLLTFFFLGLGMIAKGPVALVFFGLPAVLWCGWRRCPADLLEQAWWPGLLVFAAPWVPWYLFAERANPGFLEYFLLNENLLRYLSSDYGDRYGGGHRFPPGMAIVFFALACLPWFVVLLSRLRTREARSRARRSVTEARLGFLAFAVVVDVLFLSLSRHLLGTYVLPLLPAAALLFSGVLRTLGMTTRAQARLATILVLTYTLAFVAASPLLRDHLSADRVAEAALTIREQKRLRGRIVFVGTWPYSAHFHAAPSCCHQVPAEAGNEHFEWYVAPGNGHLIVIGDGDLERLDPWVRRRIRPVEVDADIGPYSLWLPSTPADDPAEPGPAAG